MAAKLAIFGSGCNPIGLQDKPLKMEITNLHVEC